ncbi:hypothetical protein [Halomonas denitrificans]|nr:hypothetical protein [Halomonas denitrificans]
MSHRAPVVLLALTTSLAALLAATPPAQALSCPTIPPPDCAIDSQFASGRWDLSSISGAYTLSGLEVFDVYANDPDGGGELFDDYQTDGVLSVQSVGGPSANFIDVACDGTVTGQASERISGTIAKIAQHPFHYWSDFCFPVPYDMNWTVTIDRSYSITGNVTGSGTLELDYDVLDATIQASGNYAWSDDCLFFEDPMSGLENFDIGGDTEQVLLSGPYDPSSGSWQPTVQPRSGSSWVDDVLHRLQVNGANTYYNPSPYQPVLMAPASAQSSPQRHNEYFVQDVVTVAQSVSLSAEAKTPVVTALALTEPSAFLAGVPAMTEVVATIDWRGQPPGSVRFTHGGTIETVAGADTVPWTFDAGQPGTSITAVAIAGSGEESLPYSVATPKVELPPWAGSTGNWTGSGGVTYSGTIDWPASFDAASSVGGMPLFDGPYGFSGGLSSEYIANANSSGSPAAGTSTFTVSAQLAGRGGSLTMAGSNTSTLSCTALTTEGSGAFSLPPANWQKTVNPLTVIPGLEAAACSLSGFLCDVIGSFGIKGSASASLGGSGDYAGNSGPMQWTAGSLNGELGGGISFGAGLPTPIGSIAGVRVYGSATGCIDVQVAPSPSIDTLGGSLEAGASVHFLGASASVDETLPFGDSCGRRAPPRPTRGTGWVEVDGQPAMDAIVEADGVLGAVAWSTLPAGQSRPDGRIDVRLFEDLAWGDPVSIDIGDDAARAPVAAFDATGQLLVVYMRNALAAPADPLDPAAQAVYANGYELGWSTIDPGTGTVTASGTLTQNASTDFGPSLVRDESGGVHLFWQRADGIEITGTPASPTSLHTARWTAGGGWSSEETVVTGLAWTFGWTAAAHSADERTVVWVEDADADYRTETDREVLAIGSDANGWSAPVALSFNSVVDDSPHAYYDSLGVPMVLWRSGNEVVSGSPSGGGSTVAFSTPDPSMDDGVSAAFARARVAGGERPGVTWSEDGVLWSTSLEGAAWTVPERIGTSDRALQASSLAGAPGLRVFGVIESPPGLDGRDAPTEPRFLVFDEVFVDGFESVP